MGQETKETRLHKVAKELNVGVSTIVDFLNKKGFQVDSNPNQRINSKQYDILVKEFSSDITIKKQMEKLAEIEKEKKKAISAENKAKRQAEKQNNGKNNDNSNQVTKENGVKVLGKIDWIRIKTKTTNPAIVPRLRTTKIIITIIKNKTNKTALNRKSKTANRVSRFWAK